MSFASSALDDSISPAAAAVAKCILLHASLCLDWLQLSRLLSSPQLLKLKVEPDEHLDYPPQHDNARTGESDCSSILSHPKKCSRNKHWFLCSVQSWKSDLHLEKKRQEWTEKHKTERDPKTQDWYERKGYVDLIILL